MLSCYRPGQPERNVPTIFACETSMEIFEVWYPVKFMEKNLENILRLEALVWLLTVFLTMALGMLNGFICGVALKLLLSVLQRRSSSNLSKFNHFTSIIYKIKYIYFQWRDNQACKHFWHIQKFEILHKSFPYFWRSGNYQDQIFDRLFDCGQHFWKLSEKVHIDR